MLRLSFLLLLLGGVLGGEARGQSLQVFESPEITALLQQFTSRNKSKVYLSGWRVQILATTDRVKLESTLAAFKAQYPYLPVNWIHDRPYYLLRVGAFTSKQEAYGLQQQLRPQYPTTYLMPDGQINPIEIIGYRN